MIYSKEFQTFLSEIRDFYHANNGVVWFRGHGKKDYKLIPGIYRGLGDITMRQLREVLINEKTMFLEFIDMGGLLSNEENWNNLFKMQHYGAPTRLLDWTESLSTALFFATEEWDKPELEPHLWLMNPIALNKLALQQERLISLSADDSEKYLVAIERMIEAIDEPLKVHDGPEYKFIGLRTTHAVLPKFNNSRIQAQAGRFTVHGFFPMPIEEDAWPNDIDSFEYLITLESINALKKIEIPWSIRGEIQEYQNMNGVDAFTIYPDLSGLGQKLKRKYQVDIVRIISSDI